MQIRPSAAAVFTILISIAAYAAESTQGKSPLTLRDCFDASIKISEPVKEQYENIVQAQETYSQAFGSVLPSINASATNTWQQTPNGVPSSLYPPTEQVVKLTADQPLFRGFREYAGLRQTRDLVQNQVGSWKADAILLYRDVAQQFYTVVSIENDMHNLRTEIDLNNQWIAELEARIRIGRSQLTDKLTEQVQVETLLAQLEQLDETASVARENLALDTGLAQDIPLIDVKTLPESVPAVDEYLKLVDARPEVQAAIQTQLASQENVDVQWGAHLPSIDLLGDYNYSHTGTFMNSTWDFSVALTIPIFVGGTIQSKVRQAASQERQADLVVARARRTATQDIRTWHASFLSDLQQVIALERAVTDGAKNYKAMMANYRLGLNTNIDVLTSLSAFCEDKRALDKARFAAKLDYARLESSVNREPASEYLIPPKY